MRYSVYDYNRRQYDYYDAPGDSGTHAGSPMFTRSLGGAGSSPERASWTLPLGAKKTGSGERPIGRIASMSGVDLSSDPVRLGIYAILVYIGWRVLR